MSVIVLETAATSFSLLELAFVASNTLKALIGLAIAYIAYQGYRRNQSRPMLFLSLGFVLVLGVPFLLFVLFLGLPFVPEIVAGVVSEVSGVIGLLVILYALKMDP